MKLSYTSLFVAGALLLGAGSAARASEEVCDKVLPNTTLVVAKHGEDKLGFGTGVLVDAGKRWVVTNYHVVQEAKEVRVLFPAVEDGQPVAERDYYGKNFDKLAINARPILRDRKRDLVVLELDRVPETATGLKLAAAEARRGQTVHLIGNPGKAGALWLYCSGSVRAVYNKRFPLTVPGMTIDVDARVVETQLPVDPGDSGGPVVNSKGELVAVVSGTDPAMKILSVCIAAREIRAALDEAGKAAVVRAEPLPAPAAEEAVHQVRLDEKPAPAPAPARKSRLAGTWKTTLLNADGVQVRVTLTVGDDGQTTLTSDAGNGPQRLGGSLVREGDEVGMEVNGRRERLGRVTWLDDDTFLMEDGQVSLTFTRSR